MFGPGHAPAFPRMTSHEAQRRVGELSAMDNDERVAQSSTSTSGATFYETAQSRVTDDDLKSVQLAVRNLARAHGYPRRQVRGGSLQFDQELSVLLFDQLNMLPADAADEGVWSFFTLNVCPDVALWRFPNDADAEGTIREKYERLVGMPRNVFRRSWWRGYILGTAISAQLIEDESVGIMERPSIGGSQRLARVIASSHLAHVRSGLQGSRQELLREAIKRIRRRMGQISVLTLSDAHLRDLVANAFDETMVSLHYSPRIPDVPATSQSDVSARFQSLVPAYWRILEPQMIEVDWREMAALQDQLPQYQISNVANADVAASIASDLNKLIDDWPTHSSNERQVVHAAVAYFLLDDDGIPDALPHGLDDDDEVVTAAFEALGRTRD